MHTPRQVSGLPCRGMPETLPTFPTGEQVRQYLVDYREHFGMEVHEGVDVRSADWDGSTWHLATDRGDVVTRHLVAATGIWSEPVRPRLDGAEGFPGPIMHSAEYHDPAPLAGRHVLVVGAGNSGCEIAVQLAGVAASVRLSVRSGVLFVPRSASPAAVSLAAAVLRVLPGSVGSVLVDLVRPDLSDIGLPPPEGRSVDQYPVVGLELPGEVRRGHVEVVGELDRLEGPTARFADGTTRPADAVVMATGFRPALRWLDDTTWEADDHGAPRVDALQRSVLNDRLSCVGYAYPSTEGWLQALPRVSRAAASGVVESLGTS